MLKQREGEAHPGLDQIRECCLQDATGACELSVRRWSTVYSFEIRFVIWSMNRPRSLDAYTDWRMAEP